jgi:hypothetical protein
MRFPILTIIALTLAPAAEADTSFVFVPEGSSITCTLEEGCNENGQSGISFDLGGRIAAQPLLLQTARNMLQERAQEALETIRDISPQQLLSEEVARAVVSNLRWDTIRGLTWAAREEVFAMYQCGIFKYHPDQASACWSARAFEGSDAEHVGVPIEIMPAIRSMRTELYNLGRMHLMQPSNLESVYQKVRPVMIDEFNLLFYTEQLRFLSALNIGITTAERLYEPTVVELVENFYAAEADWLRYSQLPESMRPEGDPNYFELKQVAADTLAAEIDSEWVLFFNRRHAEGGPALVEKYLESMTDFFTAVGADRTPMPVDADQ